MTCDSSPFDRRERMPAIAAAWFALTFFYVGVIAVTLIRTREVLHELSTAQTWLWTVGVLIAPCFTLYRALVNL